MKKLLIAVLLTMCLSTSAYVYAYDLSVWAEESFNNMNSYGILTTDIVSKNMKENITREEFCSLIMNIYRCDKRVVLTANDKNIFKDTSDQSVLEAYKVGIVSGKGDGIFEPQSPITRQEIAVMLSRTLNLITYDYNKYEGQTTSYNTSFQDASITAQWALSDMAAICDYKIITGNDMNEARPLDNASREQALCMLDRVYSKFIKNTSLHSLPKFKTFDNSAVNSGKIIASWPSVTGAVNYTVIIKSKDIEPVVLSIPSNTTSISEYNEALVGLENCTVFLGVTKNQNVQIFSKPLLIGKKTQENTTIEETKKNPQPVIPQIPEETVTEEIYEESAEDSENIIEQPSIPVIAEPSFDVSMIYSTTSAALLEKEKRVFPDGIYFESSEIAKEYMVEVEIPVWRLHSDGTKTSSVSYVVINKALAEDVVSIFTEIYNDSSQFPIKDVGGYTWRNSASGKLSQHSYGTCIDINWNENYYVRPDGTPITGSHWLPGEDPYSIAEDSIVVRAFAKYGWKWGGNAWGDAYAKDYMHFTYLGK